MNIRRMKVSYARRSYETRSCRPQQNQHPRILGIGVVDEGAWSHCRSTCCRCATCRCFGCSGSETPGKVRASCVSNLNLSTHGSLPTELRPPRRLRRSRMILFFRLRLRRFHKLFPNRQTLFSRSLWMLRLWTFTNWWWIRLWSRVARCRLRARGRSLWRWRRCCWTVRIRSVGLHCGHELWLSSSQ